MGGHEWFLHQGVREVVREVARVYLLVEVRQKNRLFDADLWRSLEVVSE
jgi:hypothetical protein